MRTSCVKNSLVIVVILLFIGVAVQPSIATVQPEKIDVKPKNYLFQTIDDEKEILRGINVKDYKNCKIRSEDGDGRAILIPGYISSFLQPGTSGVTVKRAFGILFGDECVGHPIYFNDDSYCGNWTRAYVFSFNGYFSNYWDRTWRAFKIDGTAKFVRVYY